MVPRLVVPVMRQVNTRWPHLLATSAYRQSTTANNRFAMFERQFYRGRQISATFSTSTATSARVKDFASSSDSESFVRSLGYSIPGHSSSINPFKLVSAELDVMTRSIRDTVSVLQHPSLDRAASHLLSLKGKRIRPIIILLMAHATATVSLSSNSVPVSSLSASSTLSINSLASTLLPSQLRLAEITELIHAASLLHDDVIDVADTRRGTMSVNSVFGNQLAVLAGDFLLARASVALAQLRDCNVVELLSMVIEHLVRGEVLQLNGGNRSSFDNDIGDASTIDNSIREDWYHHPSSVFETYLAKTFFKTASLVANSCRAVVMLAGHAPDVADAAYRYGEDVGMAFQLVDDVLDLIGSEGILGKPVLNDLRQGVATAPVLFAMEQFPELRALVDRKCSARGDLDRVMYLINEADGINRTRQLAKKHVERAVEAIVRILPASDHRSALVNMADFALQRKR